MENNRECRNLEHKREGSEDEAKEVLFFEEEDIMSGIEECQRSLVGRLLAYKAFSIGTAENSLGAIWSRPEGFKVLEHNDNVYQFFFGERWICSELK